MKTIQKITFLIAGFIMVSAVSAFAQGGGFGGPVPPPPAGVPIDGGIGILLGAGAVLGGKKAHRRLKEKSKSRRTRSVRLESLVAAK